MFCVLFQRAHRRGPDLGNSQSQWLSASNYLVIGKSIPHLCITERAVVSRHHTMPQKPLDKESQNPLASVIFRASL